MVEFLRLRNFRGCKIAAGTLLPTRTDRLTHTVASASRPEDIPPKTLGMEAAETACEKVLAGKEKKRRKAEVKAAAQDDQPDKVSKPTSKRRTDDEGTSRKKRNKKDVPQNKPDSTYVSSPTPINQSQPLNVLEHEEPVSKHVSTRRLNALRNQTNEQSPPRHAADENVDHHVSDLGGWGLDEGHEQAAADTAASYSAGGFGNLPFTPQWGLTESCRMDNSYNFRYMLSNLFTPADEEFLNEGVSDKSVLCKEMKTRFRECHKEMARLQSACDENVSSYDQLLKDYDEAVNSEKGLIERVEELKGEKKGLEEINAQQAARIKKLEEDLQKSEEGTQQLRMNQEKFTVECGKGEMVRRRIIKEYLLTFFRRLHQSVEYKRSLGKAFSLAIGKGFMDGVSIGRKKDDIQAILAATPEVDPSSTDIFLAEYEKLFDLRYPYVDKVARAYLLDPSGLQNVMPDETIPTPGQGSRNTPIASYA
ncbi:hypothetical protein Tco_0109158 [Tanacetum coccineum]